MAELVAYQIYYDEKSKENLLPGFRPYYNETCNEFFENQVIRDLYVCGDYFGVFSHRAKEKIIFKEQDQPFSFDSLQYFVNLYGCDVYGFQKRRKAENIITQADNYHPNFTVYTKRILNEIGWELPKRLEFITLFNYFVAKANIYEDYKRTLLIPAMDFMKTMPELYQDAGYKKEKPKGMSHYPYHPFICERLFSVYVQKHFKDLTKRQLY